MNKTREARLIKLGTRRGYQRLLGEESGTFGIKSGHVILGPGENVGEHTTAEREELIIVLKGKGEARVDKGSVLKIDDSLVLYIPPEASHDIKNIGSGILEYIFITSRALGL